MYVNCIDNYRHVGEFIKNDWTTVYISYIKIKMRACMLTVYDTYRHVGKFIKMD